MLASGGVSYLDQVIALGPAVLYDISQLSSLYADRSATPSTPASVDGVVGTILDLSGNGNHAIAHSDAARPILRQSGNYYYLEPDGVNDGLVVQSAYTDWGNVFIGAAFNPQGAGLYGRIIDGTYTTGFWLGRNTTTLTVGGGCVEPTTPFGQFKSVTNGTDYIMSMVRNGHTTTMRLDGANPTDRVTFATNMYGKISLFQNNTIQQHGSHYFYGAVILVDTIDDNKRQTCERWLASLNGVTL